MHEIIKIVIAIEYIETPVSSFVQCNEASSTNERMLQPSFKTYTNLENKMMLVDVVKTLLLEQ